MHGGAFSFLAPLQMARLTTILVLSLSVTSGQSAPGLPVLPLDTYPASMRETVAPAYRDARARPADAVAVGSLARLLHAWEQWDAAHAAYARAASLAPSEFDWRYLDACVLERLARPSDAAARLREALTIRPDYLPARVKLADALLNAGEVEKSRTMFTALMREPQARPEALFGLGRIAALEGKHDQAIEKIQQAISLFPEWGAAHYALALSLRALGRRDEAQLALQRHAQYGAQWPAAEDPVLAGVSALRSDPGARLRRGQKLADTGDVSGAIAEYEAALTADPSLAVAHANLIQLYGRSENWTKAEEHYRAAVTLGSDLAELHYDYGVLLSLQQKWDEAAESYRRALAVSPRYAAAHNNLGQVLERLRQSPDTALAEYRQALDSQPTFRLARFNAGRMLIALGRPEDAVVELQKLTEPRDAEAPRYLFALSTAHLRSGHKDEAVRWATEARQLALQYGDTALAAAIERDLATIR
jgi:tetratricopeptide (TPR) repeat protein